MVIAVFGATGRSGRPFVRQALERGHTLRVLVRDLARLGDLAQTHGDRISVIEGSLETPGAIEQTISGSEAIVSLIGHVKKESAPDMLADAGREITAVAARHGVRRLILLTGAGVPYEKDRPRFMDRLVRRILRMVDGAMLQDSINYVRTVRDSDLDWTVVRGPMLTEEPGSGSYRVGYAGVDVGMKCARENLATFLMDTLEEGRYLRDAPVVSDAA